MTGVHRILIEENMSSTTYGHRVYYNGEKIIERTKVPFYDSARWFVANGVSGMMEMCRVKTPNKVDMTGNISAASKLTVTEPNNGTIHVVKWTPFDKSSFSKE